jgi:methionyl-tRNA formyltransferase
MRIVLCTSGGLYGRVVLEALRDCPSVQVAGIVLSTRILRKRYGWLRGALAQARISGPRYAAYLGAVTGLADARAPSRRVVFLAEQDAIPVWPTRDVNDAAGFEFVRRLAPDLLVSGFFNQRLGEQVADLPRLGAVNIHPGELPGYRGVDPVFHALLAGEDSLAVSLHRVTSGFDEGPVLAAARMPVDGASLAGATAALFARGTRLLLDRLEQIEAGAPGTPQDGPGSYASWPTAAEVARFRRAGGRLWTIEDLGADDSG